jgi:hypothetical protein
MIPPGRSAAARAGDARSAPVQQLAPETIGVAAGLGAPGEVAFRRDGVVVGASARGQVLIAVPEVEDLEGRVG